MSRAGAGRGGLGPGLDRRFVPWLALAVAVVLAAVVLLQAERSPFARVPVLDEVWYLDRAAELQGLAAPADSPHFMSPLYPILIRLAGAGQPVPADRVVPASQLRGLRLLQLACWLGTAVLLQRIARRLLPRGGGWRAALPWLPPLLFLFYLPGAVYAVTVLLELPLVFLLTLAMWLAVTLPDARRPALVAVGLGVALGLGGLLRGAVLALLPLAALWTWRRIGPRTAAALAAAGLLVLLPPVLHNTRAAGRLCGPSLNGGVNLMIGNGPRANGFYVAVIDGDWRADPAGTRQVAAQEGKADVGLAEADQAWTRQALTAMAAHPLRTAGLWLRKLSLQLQGWEIDQLSPLAGWRDAVPVLRLFAVPWWLVVPLALAGAAGLATSRRIDGWAVVLGSFSVLMALQALFFIVSRYRLALAPMAMLLAAAGVGALADRRRSAWVGLAVGVALAVPWGLGGVRQQWQALGWANEALRWADLAAAGADATAAGRAEALYRKALDAGAPGEAPWLGLAAVLEGRGATDDAARVLARGAVAVPTAPAIRQRLAQQALDAGDPGAAEQHLRAALAARPHEADALHNLAVLRARAGDPDEAMDLARRLAAIHPDDPRGWNDLGILLARAGRRDEAVAVLRQGLARVPADPDLQQNLERLQRAATD